MNKQRKQQEKMIDGLSPEDKARWVIEDQLRDPRTLSSAERRRMKNAMEPDERRQYNEFFRRWEELRVDLLILEQLTGCVKQMLLNRDLILTYVQGQWDMMDEIVMGDAHIPLITKNPNIKPRKPVAVELMFATVHFGVGGRQRVPLPLHHHPLEPNEAYRDLMDFLIIYIRQAAAELKAWVAYIIEEAGRLNLDFAAGLANEVVMDVAYHDRPSPEQRSHAEHSEAVEEGRMTLEQYLVMQAGGGWVRDRWALKWDEIEQDVWVALSLRPELGEVKTGAASNVRPYKKRNHPSLPWLPLTVEVPDDERLEHYKKTARENPLGI